MDLQFLLDSIWNVMAHGDAREGKWRGNWQMQWVASTLHTTSEHGVSSITTADAHTSAVSSRLNWRPPVRFKWTRPFRTKDEIWFQRVCHHISTGLAHCVAELLVSNISKDFVTFIFKYNEYIHRLEYHWRWWHSHFKYQKRFVQQLNISQKTHLWHLKFIQHWFECYHLVC